MLSDKQSDVPSCWQHAFTPISCVHYVPVSAYNPKSFTIPPFKACTLTGKVRDVCEMTIDVT